MKLLLLVLLVAVIIFALGRSRQESTPRSLPPTERAKPSQPPVISAEPDTPIPFGRKSLWYAVPATSAEELAKELALVDVQVANWQSGIAALFPYPSEYVFVTPPLEGWVLAVGNLRNAGELKEIEGFRLVMSQLSTRFGRAFYFGSHRGANWASWALYEKGKERRLFSGAEEIHFNLGEPLPEEADLMAHLLDPESPEANAEGYWEREDLHSPDEDDVLRLAASWTFDPDSLHERRLPPSVGLVGRLVNRVRPVA